MSDQKFHRGDLVRIAADLGPSMAHFEADRDAIVLYSYQDRYGGSNTDSYSLWVEGRGPVSWYYEDQLTLIRRDAVDLLAQWEADDERRQTQEGDLDWIFTHGEEVLHGCSGASAQALANCFGLTNLWGARGEGFDYAINAQYTLALAAPFLTTGDKAGWLAKSVELAKTLNYPGGQTP